jgi:hypothetical protein
MRYAILNSKSTVENLIVLDTSTAEGLLFLEVQVSILAETKQTIIPVSSAQNRVAIGDNFDGENFIPIKPFPSWLWDEAKFKWISPVVSPVSGFENNEGMWHWVETNQEWVRK